ncbi:peroxide stress protein YaaA [Aquifex pyrophilus]
MIFYLLPSEGKQSSMDLVKEDLFSLWESKEHNRFPQLNPYREELIKHFNVSTSPLAPAWRRYKGKFWDSLEFWCLPPKVQQDIKDKGIILSPLFGMLGVEDYIPKYHVSYGDVYGGKKVKTFWKEVLKEITENLLNEAVVFDFLTTDQRETVSFPENAKVVRFEYIRKDKKVVNPMPHRAYTLRYIAEWNVNLENLDKINFYDYKVEDVREEGNLIKVVMRGEGKYI